VGAFYFYSHGSIKIYYFFRAICRGSTRLRGTRWHRSLKEERRGAAHNRRRNAGALHITDEAIEGRLNNVGGYVGAFLIFIRPARLNFIIFQCALPRIHAVAMEQEGPIR